MIENQKIVFKKKLPIIFVGMPGSGKSTLARLVSDQLKIPFIDTDAVFESKFSVTPQKTISDCGELKFREMETQILEEVMCKNEVILSTGGGLPCFNNQMEKLNNWGTTIFLDCQPSTLAERLKNDQTRPLINDNPLAKIILLHQSRLPIYQKAQITLNANVGLNEMLEKVLLELR